MITESSETDIGVQPEDLKKKAARPWLFPWPQSENDDPNSRNLRVRSSEVSELLLILHLLAPKVRGMGLWKIHFSEAFYPPAQVKAGIGIPALGTGTQTWPCGFRKGTSAPWFASSPVVTILAATPQGTHTAFPGLHQPSCGSSHSLLASSLLSHTCLPQLPRPLQLMYNCITVAMTSISSTKVCSAWLVLSSA